MLHLVEQLFLLYSVQQQMIFFSIFRCALNKYSSSTNIVLPFWLRIVCELIPVLSQFKKGRKMLKIDTLVLNKNEKSIDQFLYKINPNTVNIVIQIKVIKYFLGTYL